MSLQECSRYKHSGKMSLYSKMRHNMSDGLELGDLLRLHAHMQK